MKRTIITTLSRKILVLCMLLCVTNCFAATSLDSHASANQTQTQTISNNTTNITHSLNTTTTTHEQRENDDQIILFWLVVFIFLSRSLSIVKKIGIPIIVAEILTGVILADLYPLFGITMFVNSQNNLIIKFLAELGAIILMFEIGLESKFSELMRNFRSGFTLAMSGTICTFIIGYLISLFVIPDGNIIRHLLMGTIIAATATGISARTFKDMNILRSKEVKFVLIASLLDELLSIFCFAVISGMVVNDGISLATSSIALLQVIAFFVFAAIFSRWFTPLITKYSSKINSGIHMKIGVLFSICLLFSWIAFMLGLATVVGAFIAGLILDQVYFINFSQSGFFNTMCTLGNEVTDPKLRYKILQTIKHQEDKGLSELLKPFSNMFTPMFFIYIGLMIDMSTLFNLKNVIIMVIILLSSFLARIASGYIVDPHNKLRLNRLIVGLGMTPIGEAGLIFAVFGKNFGFIDGDTMSTIIATLVLASIITPILIKLAVRFGGIHYE